MSFLHVRRSLVLFAPLALACGGSTASNPALASDSGAATRDGGANELDAATRSAALDAGLGSVGSYAGLTCAQRTTDADDAIFAAIQQAEAEPGDMSCTTDSDCVVANNSSACWNGCGVVLNETGAAQLQSVVAQIDATVCASFASDGCRANTPPPCAPLLPSCVKGTCNDFPAPPGDDAGSDAQ